MALFTLTGPLVAADGSTAVPDAQVIVEPSVALPGASGAIVAGASVTTDAQGAFQVAVEAVAGASWHLTVLDANGHRILSTTFTTPQASTLTLSDLIAGGWSPSLSESQYLTLKASLDSLQADVDAIQTFDGTHTGPVAFDNDSKDETGLVVRRTAESTTSSDAEIFIVEYMGVKQTWTNEKGQLRASNTESPSDVTAKLIVAPGGADGLQIMHPDGTVVANVQADGTFWATNVRGGLVPLADGEALPAGLPDGTVIVRYTP